MPSRWRATAILKRSVRCHQGRARQTRDARQRRDLTDGCQDTTSSPTRDARMPTASFCVASAGRCAAVAPPRDHGRRAASHVHEPRWTVHWGHKIEKEESLEHDALSMDGEERAHPYEVLPSSPRQLRATHDAALPVHHPVNRSPSCILASLSFKWRVRRCKPRESYHPAASQRQLQRTVMISPAPSARHVQEPKLAGR